MSTPYQPESHDPNGPGSLSGDGLTRPQPGEETSYSETAYSETSYGNPADTASAQGAERGYVDQPSYGQSDAQRGGYGSQHSAYDRDGYAPSGHEPGGYGHGGYGQGGYEPGRPAQDPGQTLGIVSIIALVVGFVAIPVIGPIVAIVCGKMARTKSREAGFADNALGKWGFILGIVLLILQVLGFIVAVIIGAIAAAADPSSSASIIAPALTLLG